MKDMNSDEIREFLLTGTRTGKLATVRANGRPHVAPVWYDLDGETLIFMTWHASVKGKNIQRDPHISICVDDENSPFAFVIIEGQATIDTNAEQRAYWARRIGGRYMGEALAEAYGQRNGVEGELVIRLTPSKIIAKKELAAF